MPSGKATSHDGATNPKAILGLLAASFAFLVLFTSSAVPIPLYSEYRASIGLTDAAISVAMVSYLIGVCGVFFVAGSVSDAIGYRAAAVIGLLLGIGGCLLFSQVKSVPMLFAARFCQGLSCGIAMSAISAWIVDVAKGRFLVVATTIAGCGALVGVMIGSIAIGVFCAVSSNYAIMYYIVAALMALGIVFVLCAPEPPHARVRLRAAIRPITKIDPAILPVFPVAATAYLAAWIIGTYYQSFSAIVALDCFGMAAPIVGSCILALSMAPSAFGGPVRSPHAFGALPARLHGGTRRDNRAHVPIHGARAVRRLPSRNRSLRHDNGHVPLGKPPSASGESRWRHGAHRFHH